MKQNLEKTSKNETWPVFGIMLTCCLAPILFIRMIGCMTQLFNCKKQFPLFFFVFTLIFIDFGYRKLYFSGNCSQEDQSIVSSTLTQKQLNDVFG